MCPFLRKTYKLLSLFQFLSLSYLKQGTGVMTLMIITYQSDRVLTKM